MAALGTQEKANDLDWGSHPKFNISLKPTSLYSQAKPADFDNSVEAMVMRIRPVYERCSKAAVRCASTWSHTRTRTCRLRSSSG